MPCRRCLSVLPGERKRERERKRKRKRERCKPRQAHTTQYTAHKSTVVICSMFKSCFAFMGASNLFKLKRILIGNSRVLTFRKECFVKHIVVPHTSWDISINVSSSSTPALCGRSVVWGRGVMLNECFATVRQSQNWTTQREHNALTQHKHTLHLKREKKRDSAHTHTQRTNTHTRIHNYTRTHARTQSRFNHKHSPDVIFYTAIST